MPLAKTLYMNKFGIHGALARGNPRIGIGVFVIKAHVAHGAVTNLRRCVVGTVTIEGIVGILWNKTPAPFRVRQPRKAKASTQRKTDLLTAVSLRQVQEAAVGIRRVLHYLLDFFFAQYMVLDAVMRLDDNNTNRTN